jgi:hypothetical protein
MTTKRHEQCEATASSAEKPVMPMGSLIGQPVDAEYPRVGSDAEDDVNPPNDRLETVALDIEKHTVAKYPDRVRCFGWFVIMSVTRA